MSISKIIRQIKKKALVNYRDRQIIKEIKVSAIKERKISICCYYKTCKKTFYKMHSCLINLH